MKRILVFSQHFWPESFYVNEVAASLAKSGVDVDVLTGKPNYPEGIVFKGYTAAGFQNETWCGCSIFRVPLFPRGQRSVWRLALNYLSFILSGLLFSPWLLRKRRYDVVLVYGVSPILQAKSFHFLTSVHPYSILPSLSFFLIYTHNTETLIYYSPLLCSHIL